MKYFVILVIISLIGLTLLSGCASPQEITEKDKSLFVSIDEVKSVGFDYNSVKLTSKRAGYTTTNYQTKIGVEQEDIVNNLNWFDVWIDHYTGDPTSNDVNASYLAVVAVNKNGIAENNISYLDETKLGVEQPILIKKDYNLQNLGAQVQWRTLIFKSGTYYAVIDVSSIKPFPQNYIENSINLVKLKIDAASKDN